MIPASETGFGPLRWALLVLFSVVFGAPANAEVPEAEDVSVFQYNATGVRDPFIPLVRDGRIIGVSLGRDSSSAVPVLLGVLWDPQGRSIALMANGEVREGDVVGNYTVKSILQDSVILTSDEGEIVLNVVNDDGTGVGPKRP